jgi:hypothetical protein
LIRGRPRLCVDGSLKSGAPLSIPAALTTMVKVLAQKKNRGAVPSKLKVAVVVPPHLAEKSSGSIAVCKEVLDWIATHDSVLPARVSHARSEGKRLEGALRKSYDYTKAKANKSPEVLRLLEEIESQSRRADAITCNKYLSWMSAHRGMAPLEIRTCVTDADKEENHLRTRFLYVIRKADLTPEVRGLVARIEKLTQTDPDKELVIAVETWCSLHDNVLPQEYKHGTDHDELNACLLGQRYRSLKRRKAKLTPEVREIMDRIGGTSNQ